MSRSNPTDRLTALMPRLRLSLLLLISLLAAGTLLTSGCGQKGDLYLPDRADNQK
jgi:predicted small lipoprotein YifL